LKGHVFMKKHIPTFENSFILDTASQTGTRGSRRLIGEYIFTKADLDAHLKHKDAIAVFPRFGPPGGTDTEKTHIQLPYRCLVPVKTENLLVAGRSFSSDMIVNNMVNLIPHCIAMGEAAGTAAALAIKHDISLRKVNIGELQKRLIQQGVLLPGITLASP